MSEPQKPVEAADDWHCGNRKLVDQWMLLLITNYPAIAANNNAFEALTTIAESAGPTLVEEALWRFRSHALPPF